MHEGTRVRLTRMPLSLEKSSAEAFQILAMQFLPDDVKAIDQHKSSASKSHSGLPLIDLITCSRRPSLQLRQAPLWLASRCVMPAHVGWRLRDLARWTFACSPDSFSDLP